MNAMTQLPVADRWFERSRVDQATTLIVEPTHGHDDHIGGHHEFSDVRAHRLEVELLRGPRGSTPDRSASSRARR